MKLLRECSLLMLIAAAPAMISLWLHPKAPKLAWQDPGASEVELKEVLSWPAATLWVDARPTADYDHAHIADAVSLNEVRWNEQLPHLLAAWHPGMKIVVYCDSRSCDASQNVAQRLSRELRLNEIFVLKGGWTTWQQSKH